MVENQHVILDDGYYVGVRVSVRAFHFDLPKANGGAPSDLSLDQLWSRLNGGTRVIKNDAPVNRATNEQSTRFSGWKRVVAAKQTSDKAFAAPDIYRAAGGSDPSIAQQSVKEFKQLAAKVLGRCADNGTYLDETIEQEINAKSCIVHEIKVLMLYVSSTDNGGRFDENTKKWYAECTMRKFYVSMAPLSSLITALADEIADATTNVNAEGKLVAVRSDGVTPRTGRNARTSNFRIQKVDSYGDSDEGLRAVIDRLRAKIAT
jgi:hypothetical protein